VTGKKTIGWQQKQKVFLTNGHFRPFAASREVSAAIQIVQSFHYAKRRAQMLLHYFFDCG